MPDTPRRQKPLTPEEITSREFGPSRRGIDADEVRSFLAEVADELTAMARREQGLRRQVSGLEEHVGKLERRLQDLQEQPVIDENALMVGLGEEAATILRTAHDAADDLRAKGRADVSAIVRTGEADAARIRGEAENVLAKREREAQAEAGRIIDAAKAEALRAKTIIEAEAAELEKGNHAKARELVEEALATRERVLGDLTRRRRVAQAQIEQLRAGRERLLDAYRVVRRTLDEVTDELQRADAEARAASDRERARRANRFGSGAAPKPGGGSGPSPTRRSPAIPPAPPSLGPISTTPSGGRSTPRFHPGASALDFDFGEDGDGDDDDDPWPGPAVRLLVSAPEPDFSDEVDDTDFESDFEHLIADEAPARESPPVTLPLPPMPPTRPLFSVPEPSAGHGDTDDGDTDDGDTDDGDTDDGDTDDGDTDDGDTDDGDREVVVVIEETVVEQVSVHIEVEPPAPAPAPAPEPELVSEIDGGRSKPAVDELFARLRANRAEAVARAEQVLAPDGDDDGRPTGVARRTAARRAGSTGEVPVTDEDEAWLQRRDRVLDAVQAPLTKKLKRALQDEQNDLLDRLRSLRQRPSVENLLPGPAEQADRYRAAATPFLGDASLAGARFLGGADQIVDVADLAGALAGAIVGPLRSRLERALANDHGDDTRALADDIGAAYREWKSQRIDDVAGDQVTAAFAWGALASVPPGTALRWIVDDQAGPCPDCDDNALARPTAAGEEFPTGQLHPPAHAGCRCLLVRDDS